MADDRSADTDLEARLRNLAEQLDEAVEPISAKTVTGGSAQGSTPSPAKPWLVAAAVVAVVGLLAALAVTTRSDDREALHVGERSTTDPDTTDPPDSAHTVEVPPEMIYSGTAWDDLPPTGLAVVTTDATTLFTMEGHELGRIGVDHAAIEGSGSGAVDLLISEGEMYEGVDHPLVLRWGSDHVEAPNGCEAAAGGGGVRVALCGGAPHDRPDIVVAAPTGATRRLTGPPPGSQPGIDLPAGEIIGHWRYALPSPDGRWVLGQWSGECEASTTFVISVETGAIRSLSGPDDEAWLDTSALAWTHDGRALVQFGDGICGARIDTPGVYSVDVTALDRSLLVPKPETASTAVWRKDLLRGDGDLLFARLLEETGLDGGGDHMIQEVAGVLRWDGIEIPIAAHPNSGPPTVWFNDLVLWSVEYKLGGLPVTVGEADQGRFLAFTCGGRTWTLGGAGGGDRATESQLRDLALAVFPYLYCTVGERPQATGHGPPG